MAGLPQSEKDKRIKAVEKWLKKGFPPLAIVPGSTTAYMKAAKGLGLSTNAIKKWFNQEAKDGSPTPDHSLFIPDEAEVPDAVEAQRDTDTIRQLQTELRDLRRRLNHQEDVERMAMGLKDYPLDIPAWTYKQAGGAGKHREAPILFTSDFQFGEVVDLDEMEGINEYNVEIAERRYDTLINKTVDLCFHHTANPDFPGLIYLRGGDAISGGIHDELAQTDEYSPPEAVVALARKEISGIEHCADKFGRVHVISVPGNHDRITKKKQHKRMAATSYELMVQAMIQIYFEAKADSRVTFHSPKSGDAYFPVWGWQFLLTHGDRIGTGGGTGYIGPIATITRGFAKIKRQHAGLGKILHFILTGHYHTSCEPPGGFGNGSLVGYGEYARDLRADPEPPCQWLLMVHPEQGVTQRRKIFVEPPRQDMDGNTVWTAIPARR
jgi:hypothetical protein